MFLISLAMLVQTVPAAQPAVAPAAEDKVLCRMIQEPQSRIPSRICRKKSEWAQIEKDTQDALRSSRNQRTGGAMGQ